MNTKSQNTRLDYKGEKRTSIRVILQENQFQRRGKESLTNKSMETLVTYLSSRPKSY